MAFEHQRSRPNGELPRGAPGQTSSGPTAQPSGARGCRIASVPPSTYSTEPTTSDAASESRKAIGAATSSGRPSRPSAEGYASDSGPKTGSAASCSVIAVATLPGATELRRIPAPAHSRVTPVRRAHQASAALVAG